MTIPFKEFLPKFLKYAEHKRMALIESKRQNVDVEIPEENDEIVMAKIAKLESNEQL